MVRYHSKFSAKDVISKVFRTADYGQHFNSFVKYFFFAAFKNRDANEIGRQPLELLSCLIARGGNNGSHLPPLSERNWDDESFIHPQTVFTDMEVVSVLSQISTFCSYFTLKFGIFTLRQLFDSAHLRVPFVVSLHQYPPVWVRHHFSC